MADSRRRWRWVLLGLGVVLVPPGAAVGVAAARLRATIFRTVPAPESPTGLRAVSEKRFAHAAVVAAHPEAARIGARVLQAGGSAIDAAVAVQAALTLVEPQSSGIGGGAFLLYYDARSGQLTGFDGRETAPAAATPELFLGANGKPMSFPQALLGGRSVGVPGVVAMLAMAHARFGHRPWAELFVDAAALAEHGFAVTPRLHQLLKVDPVLPAIPSTRSYFFGADDWPLAVGTRLVNKPLAETLRAIASGGASAFYGGPVAADIVSAVRSARRPSLPRAAFNLVAREWGIPSDGTAGVEAPGTMALDDLASYRPVERAPVCIPYRRYKVCSMPPPAGGVSVLEALRLLERFPLAEMGPGSDVAHLMAQAEALADADRDRWVGDPSFVQVPTEGLVDADYLRERGKQISLDTPVRSVTAGKPPGAVAEAVPGESFERPSTSHFVVVDGDGSVACVTTSIEFGFGSHVMVRGFLLNNQLTDFAFTPVVAGRTVVNSVQPGKRPRSASSPVIVFDGGGKPVFAVGSPGGPRIIGFVAQTLVNFLDFGQTPNRAIAAPRVVYSKGQVEIEDAGWAGANDGDAFAGGLRRRGDKISVEALNSGLHAIALTPEGLVPGIDPRREGEAEGY